MRRNLFILFLVSVVLILSATVVYAQSIDEDIEGLTYKGGDIDDVISTVKDIIVKFKK